MDVSTCRQCPGWSGAAAGGLLLPAIPAQHGQHGDLVVTELKGIGHRTQLSWIGNVTGLDGRPFGCLHTGQTGCFLDRTAGGLTSFPDTVAEKPSPDLAPDRTEVILP